MTWDERRRIAWLLAAATLIPIAALTWLSLRILQQDRDIERQRQREYLEVAAGRLALDFERRLQDVEQQLARGAGVRLVPDGLDSPADAPLLYQPEASAEEPARRDEVTQPEVEEFQRRDLSAATAAYRRLASSPTLTLRAAALVGLGRVLRQRGDRAGALRAYSDLQQLGPVAVSGQPAGLIARQGRCKVLEEARDREGLQKAVADLARALDAGGWPIDRATFDLYRDMVERWGGPAPLASAIVRTDAGVDLWRMWHRGDLPPRGRRIMWEAGGPVLAVWVGGPEHPLVWLAASAEIEASLRPQDTPKNVTASIHDFDGRLVLGRTATGGISLTPGETRLPFIVSAFSTAASDVEGEATHRIVLIGGLATLFVLMLAAASGVYRVTMREMTLAQQQSDFVSAVSHEFRTPLTSMRHLTDLLVSRGVASEERKAQYYELLAGETERLHRMVESLLSFGRIEAGAYAWRLEPADPSELVRGIVDEFRHEPGVKDREVVFEPHDGLQPVLADREAFSRALSNLLENAVKYSAPPTPVRVFLRREGESVLVSVSDRGIGIGSTERERIFQKFVRGADAKRAGIRGVGLGLALVKRIVEAHGGAVRLDSEPGRGSTFTLVLPGQG